MYNTVDFTIESQLYYIGGLKIPLNKIPDPKHKVLLMIVITFQNSGERGKVFTKHERGV